MSARLVNGIGSDLQLFGYDELLIPEAERIRERGRSKALWRRLRQELYLDQEVNPFAVVNWAHGISEIRLVSVEAVEPGSTLAPILNPAGAAR